MAKDAKTRAQKRKRRAARVAKKLHGRQKTYEVTHFEDGKVRAYSVPMGPELHEELLLQRERFREKFGREPGPNDPIFFDPEKDVPTPLGREFVAKAQLEKIAALERIGASPAVIHALKVTGLLIAQEAYPNVPDDRLAEWLSGLEEGEDLHPDGQACNCEPDLSDQVLGL